MKTVAAMLAFALVTPPAFAQAASGSIRASIEKHASDAAAAEQRTVDSRRGARFWSGLALGIAGVTTAVLAVTVARVDDSSTGNAPENSYQMCVAQKSDPIYASNQCNMLKGKNVPMLASGVAIGALGAALLIGGSRTSADVSATGIRLKHTFKF